MIPIELADSFNKFGVPVIVALLTTLVVEYFAKPRLEARKARLIRDRQQIDEVIFAFQKTALLAAALLPDDTVDVRPEIKEIQMRQLSRLEPTIEAISDAIARLPTQFVATHSWHVGAASYYASFFSALVWIEMHSASPQVNRLREIGKDISEFDAYFAAHASFRDSQEPWAKRAFSRRFMKRDYRLQAQLVLEKHGLQPPDSTPE